jgi:hypothetical protein
MPVKFLSCPSLSANAKRKGDIYETSLLSKDSADPVAARRRDAQRVRLLRV